MKNDTIIYLVWLIFGILVIWAFLILVFLYDEPKPKKETKVLPEHKTEVMTHEIRCVEHTSNFCVKYKVFKIIKE